MFYSTAPGCTAVVIRFVSCFVCGCVAGLLIRLFYSGRGSSFFDFTGFCEGVSRDTDPNLLLHFLKNVWRNIKANGPMIALGRYMYTARLRTFGEVEEFIQWVQG